MTENEIGKIVVDSAINIHKKLGPGLLETVYEIILANRLKEKGLSVERQVPIPIEYEGIKFNEGFKADIVIDNKVILELKSVESVTKVHKKQILTYLKLTSCRLGFLLNLGEALMKNGISRIINGKIK